MAKSLKEQLQKLQPEEPKLPPEPPRPLVNVKQARLAAILRVEAVEKENIELKARVADLERMCAALLYLKGAITRPHIISAIKNGRPLRPTFTKSDAGSFAVNFELHEENEEVDEQAR